MRPYWISAALEIAALTSLLARVLACSSCSLAVHFFDLFFSDCLAFIAEDFFEIGDPFSISSSRAFDFSSVSRVRACRSISSWRISRSRTSISCGRLSISIRIREAASSIKSIALSGRNRSVMYRFESVAAATIAASLMRTP